MKTSVLIAATLLAVAAFDPNHSSYRAVLERFVRPPRVDYAALKSHRGDLDSAIRNFGEVSAAEERAWPLNERIAFWTNAYNAFTLRAIVDHYPITGSFFSRSPRNSIRQIDGVWTKLTWQAAGRRVTLDDIDHRILRPELKDSRVHFALTCASVGCPPLRAEPYRAADLDRQLDEAARIYLGSAEGLRLDGETLRVSSIFKWYGEDFVERYGSPVGGRRDPRERAILGVIAQYGLLRRRRRREKGGPGSPISTTTGRSTTSRQRADDDAIARFAARVASPTTRIVAISPMT